MSPVTINGRAVGVASNGVFTAANTDAVPGGILWNGSGAWAAAGDLGAALAWNDMREYIGAKHGVWIVPAGSLSTARPFAGQVQLRNEWCARGDCGKAAVPGTSNHGWAIAIDVLERIMAFFIRKYAAKFGFSFDEGDRVGEWWHVRYIGTYMRRVTIDPLTRRERRLLKRYERAPAVEREHIRDEIAQQIRAIRHAAAAEHDGWGKHHRAGRYKALTAWFNRVAMPRYLTDRECALISSYYGGDAAHKRRSLARINAQRLAVRDLARARGWEHNEREQRFQYLSKFYDDRKAG
jgi:hypothetical protein